MMEDGSPNDSFWQKYNADDLYLKNPHQN